ncbi:uncharacterized protein METZ01_LOCUS345910 [marine metagenome]|uniref:Uncharacterized protein n=1 Tax=marine metagenome TaxID=408172 RepID=A0A382R5T4_9ZZZZ
MTWAWGIWLVSAPGQTEAWRERDAFRVNATRDLQAERAFFASKGNEVVSRLGLW